MLPAVRDTTLLRCAVGSVCLLYSKIWIAGFKALTTGAQNTMVRDTTLKSQSTLSSSVSAHLVNPTKRCCIQQCMIHCRAEQISAHPRAYVYHNFLSSEECDHIVALARPRVKAARAHQCGVCYMCTCLKHVTAKHADEEEHGGWQGWAEHRRQYQDQLWHIP